MKKRLLTKVSVILVIISIAVIAYVGLAGKLYALNKGVWLIRDGQLCGCVGSGTECEWGAPSTDY